MSLYTRGKRGCCRITFMRKNIKKNSIKILKSIDENNLGSIARVFLSSFILILFLCSSLNNQVLQMKNF